VNDERYEVARKRVIQKLILRATFVFNVIFFGLVTLLLSRQGINTESDRLGVVFFVLIFGSALAVHGALAFNLFGLISPLINRLTQRELEQIRLAEKPKRREFELGEDGEMIEIDEEIAPVTAKHKSGG
jgi:hypothetical protein